MTHRLIPILALVIFLAAGSLPIPPQIVGPDGPAKAAVAAALDRIPPTILHFVQRIYLVGTRADWRAELEAWPVSCPALCRRDTGFIFIRAIGGEVIGQFAVWHEVGHALWNLGVGGRDRAAVRAAFDSGPWPTKYSRRSAEEFFAEVFATRIKTGSAAAYPAVDEVISKFERRTQ